MRLRLVKFIFVLVTLLYAVVTPPFQVHDERNHFFKSYQVSEGAIFNTKQGGELGLPLPARVSDIADRLFPIEVAGDRPAYHWADLVRAWSQPDAGEGRPFTAFSNIANYSPTLYGPQALGILAARQAGAPLLAQFYAGRLVNALVGAVLVLTAVALMPLGGTVMMAVAALPMVCHQIGSLSADSSIIGLSFLAIAASLHLARRATPPRWALLGPGLLALLALAKGVYVPVALAGLAVLPRRRWYVTWLAASLIVGIAAVTIWLRLNSGNFVRQAFVARRSLAHVRAALPGEQFAYVVAHPFEFLVAVTTSFAERLPVYVVDGIGRFGWFTVQLPIPLYMLALAVVGMAVVAPGNPRPLPQQRLFWAALVVGGCGLIESALYMTATELGAGYVEGVQGRYFLPYVPLLGLALMGLLPTGPRVACVIQAILGPAMIVLMVAGLVVDAVSFWPELTPFGPGHR